MDRILFVVAAAGAIALLGFILAWVVIVSVASWREDSVRSMSGLAPGRTTRAARRLVGVDPGGFIFSLPPDGGWHDAAVLVLVRLGVARQHGPQRRIRLDGAASWPPPGPPSEPVDVRPARDPGVVVISNACPHGQ